MERMTIRHSWALLGLIALLMISCRKEGDLPQQDIGTGYFPLRLGAWVEYQVDSMWRDDLLNVRDSVSYRLLEHVEEAYLDGAGRTAYRILRSVRNEQDEWQVRDVWTSTKGIGHAEMTEENKRRLKMSFPVRAGRSWDVNVYNADRPLEVSYRDVDRPWTGDALSFERTVMVQNVLGPNAIERRDLEERYAYGVGLVEKRWEETNTQFNSTTQQFVVRGFRLNMVAVAYGQP